MTAWERWKQYPQQVFIAFDQLVNALIPPFITVSWADETLSARIFRAARRGRFVGRIAMPPVDLLFSLWQKDAQGQRLRNHCEAAYHKEMERRNLPPEYRVAATKGSQP